MSGYLVDTSVFIAGELGRRRGDPPAGQSRISVATLTELMIGVRTAKPKAKAVRELTLSKARSFIALPYDEFVADRVGVLVAATRNAGRRVGIMDAIIAATALVHDLAVWTQDDDFRVLAELVPDLEVTRA